MSALPDASSVAFPAHASGSWIRPATIRAVHEDGRVDVRVSFGDSTEAVTARVLQLAGYQPVEGDRVLVAGERDADEMGECFIIGVVHSVCAPRLEIGDGSHVQVKDGELELRDAEDRLLLRYADGHAELAAPTGDLQLCAPNGRVVLRAATDVSIEAVRDVAAHAGRRIALDVEGELSRLSMDPSRTTLETPKLEVRAKHSEVATAKVTLMARRIAVTAERVAQNVEHYELQADKLVQRARNSVQEVTELAQSTVGRARAVVRGIYSLRSKRTIMVSKDDTSIDGERILLG
jgi:hypothetical protein